MQDVTAFATIAGSMAAVATLANAVWQYQRKTHLEIFRIYADKYNEILKPDIYKKWVRAVSGERELWEELNPTLIRYLNLVWEEAYLSKSRAIPRRLWKIWLPEITHVLSSEFVRNAATTYDFHFPVELIGPKPKTGVTGQESYASKRVVESKFSL